MNKQLQGFLVQLLGLSAVLIGIHYYIFLSFFAEVALYFPIWAIYAFNLILVLAVYLIVYTQVKKGSKKGYQLFLSLTTTKMILALVFLLPVFFGKSDNPMAEVINFFIPYFFFLAFEIWSLNKFFSKL